MYSTIVIVLCIGIVGAYNDLKELDRIEQEYECSSRGGLCTIDCPKDRLSEKKGLCPLQRSIGVECCYGVSEKETRCRKRGGECSPGPDSCKPSLIDQKATDCPKNTVCCILTQ